MRTQLLIYIFVLSCCTISVHAQGEISLSGENKTGGTYTACSSISLKNTFSFSATATGKSLHLSVSPSTCDPFGGTDIDPSKIKDQNYIRTKTYLDENASRYLDQIQYFDGLGRPVEIVQRAVTPSAKDLVTYQEYDPFGRESNIWLPAVVAGNNGVYVAPSTVKANSISSNGNDQSPYSQPVYEASPLNRVLEQYGPGKDWQTNKKSVKTEYLTNTSSGELACVKYISGDNLTAIEISRSGNYANAELYVTKMTDEDGRVSYEFKDKLGQIILTRQMDGTAHDTYFIYDSFGNLKAVFPPLAADAITANAAELNAGSSTRINLAYLYAYDGHNRCISKKLPGADWIHYVYDTADHLIFTQDGEQRTKNEWTFSLYDAFGRTAVTGICGNTIKIGTAATSTSIAPGCLDTYLVTTTWAKINPNAYKGYNLTGITLTNPVALSVNYYDNYEFMGLNSVPATTDANFKYTAEPDCGTWYAGDHTDANKYKNKGMLTGSITTQFKPDGTVSADYLYTVMYYDYKGQLVQVKSNSHLSGGFEKEYIAYNFTGQPVKRKHTHSATGKTSLTEFYAYVYDHAGRLQKTTHQLQEGTAAPKAAVVLAQNTYDELGRLSKTVKNNQANLTTGYTYNIRSWTKSITGPLFTQNLYYNESFGIHGVQYAGNISAMTWKNGNEAQRIYAFKYDNLSQLIHAAYDNKASGGSFSTAYTYDKHGNMKTLTRLGKKTSTTYDVVDNLTITHTGNQLLKIEDAVPIISLAESADFKNYSNVATEYYYNANGAMYKDLNKGISNIQYNILNLPRILDIKSPVAEARNEYTYTSAGRKLKVVQKWNPDFSTSPVVGSNVTVTSLTKTETTDYVGNIIYESRSDGTSKTRILIDGGYIEGGLYYFYLTDHLGNNRIVANASGTVIQKNHYYPFGMAFSETPLAEQKLQPYKYNNKEFDSMHGLNLYDYSARYMDAALPGFTTVDPLAEKYYHISPYVYCANNPLRFVDPNGKQIVGLTQTDASKVQQDFNIIFASEQFEKFRGLLTLDKSGTTFNSISKESITTAFEGISLSQDEQALVNEVSGAINSESIHKVEYVDISGSVSAEASSTFRTHLNKSQAGFGDALIPTSNMPGSTMNAISGGGINIPTNKGSHSVIMEGKGVFHDGGRALVTGHEIVGHGVASASGVSHIDNNIRAVRIDNLIRRVLSLPAYPRIDHSGVNIPSPSALP